MGFFDELGDEIVNTTKDIGKMAQNAGDITKLQYEKKVKEQELSKLYEKLGKKYYEDHKEEDNEDFTEIKDCLTVLKEINDSIVERRGGKSCPKCGNIVKNGDMYCSSCGEKVNDIFEED